MPAADRTGPRVVDVFAEVACPFTHVVVQRLVRERVARGLPGRASSSRSLTPFAAAHPEPAVLLRVLAWPLELVNGRPLSPRGVGREVAALREQVEPDLFEMFSEDRFPASSLPALALASAGYDVDLLTGEAVSLSLRTALFERGHDISSESVLAEIAESHGLLRRSVGPDFDAVQAEYRDGQGRNVRGSPHFFVGEQDFFCPGLTIAETGGHFDIRPDESSWEAFIAACFG